MVETTDNFKQTRIGKIPVDWELKKIEDVSIKVTDGTHDTPKTTKSGVPYITAIHVKDGFINFDECYFVSKEVHEQIYSRCNPEKDDLLLVNIGAGTATPARVKVDYQFSMKNVALIKPNHQEIDGAFLESYQLFVKKKLFKRLSSGGAQPFLSLKDIKKLDIVVPKLEEQRKISSILSTWDKAIELKEKLIEQKKEQKTGLIETLLSGKKRIKGFNGEWKQVKLKEISHINKESLSNNTSSNYEFYYYDISSVENGNVAIQKDLIKFLDAPSRARRVFHENDILMSTVRPNLKGFAFIDFEVNDAICSTGFAVITAEEVATNKLIYYNLFSKGIETQIEKLIVGSNYPAINASEVGNLKIYYPLDHNERQQIVDIIYCADKELKLLQLELKFLKEQKQALMQQLLTGKIRVKV